MGLINKNETTSIATDDKFNETYIRIIQYTINDHIPDATVIVFRFAVYSKKAKWDSKNDKKAWTRNALPIVGINGDTQLTLPYNRAVDGVDVQALCYTHLRTHLLQRFPEWAESKLTFDIVE